MLTYLDTWNLAAVNRYIFVEKRLHFTHFTVKSPFPGSRITEPDDANRHKCVGWRRLCHLLHLEQILILKLINMIENRSKYRLKSIFCEEAPCPNHRWVNLGSRRPINYSIELLMCTYNHDNCSYVHMLGGSNLPNTWNRRRTYETQNF